MIRSTLLSVLLIGSCFADVTTWNNDQNTGYRYNHLDNIKGLHYSQHEASVHAARKGAAERLARIGGSAPLTDPCGTLCFTSTGLSDASDAETLGQGIVGFTNTGSGSSSSSSNSKYQASSRQESAVHAVQPIAGASKSSYVSSSHRQSSSSVASGGQPLNLIVDSEGVKTRSNFGTASGATVVQPVYSAAYPIGQESQSGSYSSSANRKLTTAAYGVPVETGNAYSSRSSYAAASETASVQQPVIPVHSTASDHSAKYAAAGRQDGYQRYAPSGTYVVYSKPVQVPIYTSTLDTSARFSDAEGNVYTPVKVVYPARTSSHSSAVEEQQYSSVAGHQQPVQVFSNKQDQAAQSASIYRGSYRPVYQSAYGSHAASSERTAESQVRSSEVSSVSNRVDERQEDYARRGSVYTPIPLNQGSGTVSKYSTFDQRNTQTAAGAYAPIAPIAGSSSSESSSKYTAQQQHQQRASYTPIAFQPVSSSSQYTAQEQSRQQASSASGGSYYPINQGRYSSADSQHSAYRHQQASKTGSSYHQQQYPIVNDALGMRFGATGMEFGDNNDLTGLMSESERLAKLQAKNAYNGAVSGSSAIETENRFGAGADGDNVGATGGFGSGAFQRTKSWSSSSKWASGQKFGEDGNIKSYSSLSTAESEQHNVNGKKTGYKAATTTLEDDGKVSTYSLHTP
ncbi:hornerin-like isoform X1 [Uranotaenia lowii]|uniref:hornerin-like isoform X1 n=1 Tax=Uranotaenia lowii TaxID=190385 RepID=UPI002478B11B|nr:hornerin-like isoform X1 [Uranotaenia lowii]